MFPYYFTSKGYQYTNVISILKAKGLDSSYLYKDYKAKGTYDKSKYKQEVITNEGYLTSYTIKGKVRKRKLLAYY